MKNKNILEDDDIISLEKVIKLLDDLYKEVSFFQIISACYPNKNFIPKLYHHNFFYLSSLNILMFEIFEEYMGVTLDKNPEFEKRDLNFTVQLIDNTIPILNDLEEILSNHNDLKPENIVIKDIVPSQFTVYLIDFDVSYFYGFDLFKKFYEIVLNLCNLFKSTNNYSVDTKILKATLESFGKIDIQKITGYTPFYAPQR